MNTAGPWRLLLCVLGLLWARLAAGQPATEPAGEHITAVTVLTPGTVGQYEKFEIGLALDRAFTTGQPHGNPYDPADVSVEAYFISPSGQTLPVRYGFYYKEFAIRNQYLQANDARYWNGTVPTPQPWRVRFAPNEVGSWQYIIKVVYWDFTFEVLPARTFTCVASANSGFLKVADNRRNLIFDSGRSFFAIGSNVDFWGGGAIRVPTELPAPPPNSPNLRYCDATKRTPVLELPPGQNAAFSTYTYSAYEQVFRELHSSGGNFARVWMQPSNWDLETYDSISRVNTLGNYEANQARMYDFDRLLGTARQQGIYIHLSLLDGIRLWSIGQNSNWRTFPYHTAPQLALATPEAFFTDPRARQFFKNKIRYVVARWGYSANIASYELINEGDFVNAGALFLHPFKERLPELEDWTLDMARYLKQLDERHLQTLAYGPENSVGLLTHYPELFDYSTSHFYTASFNAEVQRNYLTQQQMQKLGRPYQLQEYDFAPYINTAYQAKFHSPHWSTAFSGAFGIALPLAAFANIHNPCFPAYRYYQPLARFLAATHFSSAADNQPIGNSAAAAAAIYGPDYAARLAAAPRDSTHAAELLTTMPATANPAYASPCERLCPPGWPISAGVASQNAYEFDKPEYLVDGIRVSEARTGTDTNALIEVFALQNPDQITGWVHNKTHYWYNLPHSAVVLCDTSGGKPCPNTACLSCGTNPALPTGVPTESSKNTVTPLRGQQLAISNLPDSGTYRVRWFYTQPGLDVDRNGVLNDGGFLPGLEQPAVAVAGGLLTIRIPPLVALGADGPTTGPDYAFVIARNVPGAAPAAPAGRPSAPRRTGGTSGNIRRAATLRPHSRGPGAPRPAAKPVLRHDLR